jgi:hypothetical protein
MIEEYAFNWQVFAAIVFIVAAFTPVVKAVLKLNGTLTRLDTTLALIQKDCERREDYNRKEHDAILSRLAEHDDALNAHDKYIAEIKLCIDRR